MITDVVILLVAVVLGVLRVTGVKHIAFQAIAHLFVGGLFGAWLVDRRYRLFFWVAVALTIVETIVFIVDRFLR